MPRLSRVLAWRVHQVVPLHSPKPALSIGQAGRRWSERRRAVGDPAAYDPQLTAAAAPFTKVQVFNVFWDNGRPARPTPVEDATNTNPSGPLVAEREDRWA
jgi:hypothetical protein